MGDNPERIAHNPDEIIAVVDESDSIIGSDTRKHVHENGLLHREVFVFLINSENKVLLQRRTDNKKFDQSAGGHMSYDQGYLEGAAREFKEELGISLEIPEFQFIAKERTSFPIKGGANNSFITAFIVRKDIPRQSFSIDTSELDEVSYFGENELKALIYSPNMLTSPTRMFLEKYIIPIMSGKKF